jgi:ABC-2 type transport system ATP-binding protein
MSERLPTAVDCRNVTYRYGQFTAVNDVTLQVRPGETMGLLGPNGAGKTTLVRMLTTLAPVQQGELRIFGMDARDRTVDIRSNIGYVPQQLSLEPALTGRQNVQWFARLYGVPRARRAERVDQALEAMELLDVADRLAGTYSGGMVRRLEVAQALVNHPSLLVLDEPTVGLDPIARDGVWTHVQSMQAQFGMTVLLTTHYMEEADALCDRVSLMHRGALRAVGTPARLKAQISKVSRHATLEDVFRHYTAEDFSSESEETEAAGSSGFREIRSSRKVASRAS